MTMYDVPSVEIGIADYLFSLNRFDALFVETELEKNYMTLWGDKSARGVFRYEFDRSKVPSKTIPSDGQEKNSVKYVVQLNLDRSLKKRDAEEIVDIKQPFDESRFNFTKISEDEILFKVKLSGTAGNEDDSFVAINVSPLELGHTLILPDLKAKLPQILTEKSMILAVNLMLCIHSPDFRVGYNGLLAFASVNHLHLHCYYLNYNMSLETIPVEHLAGHCFTLTTFPAKGFVFQIRHADEITAVLRSILALTNFLVDRALPHNLYMTRGLSFDKASRRIQNLGERDCLRVYIWTRKPTVGAKTRVGLHPALCELFGHFLIKDEETFQQANESWITNLLIDLTDNYFNEACNLVKDLFAEMPPKSLN